MNNCYEHFKLCVCRLCLKMTPDNNCSILTEETWTILKALIPEMTVSGNMDHITKICNICTEILQMSDKFRKECFNKDSQKINTTDKNMLCAFCQKDSIDVHEEQDIKRQKETLQKCFPDVDIDFKENSSCCKVCSKLLETFLTFIKNYRKTEEDIQRYCLKTGNSSQEANILEEVSAFVSSNSTTGLSENISPKNIPTDAGVSQDIATSRKERPRHSKKIILTNKYNCANCSYSANSKSALISHMVSHRALSEATNFKCEICNHQTKRKGDLIAHMIVHKDSTELKMFKCTLCPYESKRNGDLKQHMISHGITIYKCKYCPFQTTYQKYLKYRHMPTHKLKSNFSELKFHKCDKCPYQTENKYNLKAHTRHAHREVQFSCNWCTFTTYNKGSLREHVHLLHRPTSEINMFKCANCEFETKRKRSIVYHLQQHINSAHKTFKCEKCNSTLKTKRTLAAHLRDMHPDLSKVRSFECYTCGFVTRLKRNIKSHIIGKHLSVRNCATLAASTKNGCY